MRSLSIINDFFDIYHPVSEDDIQFVEKQLGLIIPIELKAIYRNPDIKQIKSLPTLLWPVNHDTLGIIEANKKLQLREYDPFPSFLIAFATNECGDFWVINSQDQSVTYIDPDETIEENLDSQELYYKNFSEWLQKS